MQSGPVLPLQDFSFALLTAMVVMFFSLGPILAKLPHSVGAWGHKLWVAYFILASLLGVFFVPMFVHHAQQKPIPYLDYGIFVGMGVSWLCMWAHYFFPDQF